MKFESHKASTMLTVWKCPYCGQTFAVGDDKELLEDGSTRKMPLIYSIEPIYCPLCGKALNERSTNMAVNTDKELWESIAKHFGLELKEEFRLKEIQDTTYRFTYKGLEDLMNGVWAETLSSNLNYLMHKRLNIVKIPWKPKNGDVYYYIELYGDPNIYHEFWEDDCYDEQCYETHNCFRTVEEAKEKFRKILEVLNNEE